MGSEFCDTSMKSFLQENNIEIYSIHNKGKCVVAELFIWTLKTKINKNMTSIWKNVSIDKLEDIWINTTIFNIAKPKWGLLMLKIICILTLAKKVITKIVNIKLVMLLEYQNIKIFWIKDIKYLLNILKLVWRSIYNHCSMGMCY